MEAPSSQNTMRPVISAELSTKFTVVSFLSTCSVVVLHAYEGHLAAGTSATAWIVTFVGWTLPSFAVSIFFAISGYLLCFKSNGQEAGWYGKALRKRVRTLLVPYLAWCSIYALTVVPFTMYGNHLAHRDLFHHTPLHEPLLSFWNLACIYGADWTGAPANGVLWYIRDLVVLVVLAPLLIKLLSGFRRGWLCLGLMGAAFFLHDWVPACCWQFFETGFSLRGLFFFCAGIYIALHQARMPQGGRWRILLPVAWLGASLLFTYFRLHPSGTSLTVQRLLAKAIVVLGTWAVWVWYDLAPGTARLSRYPFVKESFFLYAAHLGIMFVFLCARVQEILRSRLHFPVLAIFALRCVVPIVLSLAAAAALRRFLPRVHGWLTGGR